MTDRAFRAAGAAVLALFGVWAGARFYSAHRPIPSRSAAALRVPAGEASAPSINDWMPETGSGAFQATQIPDRLPVFALGALDGRRTPVSTWSDRSLVLNFWATWCAPCRREIPLLQRLNVDWRDKGFQVVGVAVDDRDKVASFARQLKIDFPVLVGDQDALDLASKLGMQAPVFPFTVFADRQGRVVALYVGELHAPEAALIMNRIEDVNAGRTEVTAARKLIAEGLKGLSQAASG